MPDKKRILVFIDWFMPGYKAGGPVSSNRNLITHLKDQFQFKVVTRNTEYMESIPYPEITPNEWIQINGFSGYYISNTNLSFSVMKKIIKDTPFDIAYVNGIYSWYFSILPLLLLKYYKKEVLVSARGMLSPHALEVKSTRKKFFLFAARTFGLYRKVIFHATNEQEAVFISQVLGTSYQIRIASNLSKPVTRTEHSIVKHPDDLKLIYVGRVAPEKNTLFAVEVLQQVSTIAENKTLNIQLSIYGSVYNQSYWSECEAVIGQLPSNVNVIFYGPVEPAEIEKVLLQNHFLLQPSKGENYGHTIAESLQNGVPVIISDKTPWRHLQQGGITELESSNNNQLSMASLASSIGWDLSLDHPERFVEVIEYCAHMEQEEYNAMSQRAFDYAKQVTQNPAVIEANRKLFGI
jgi:glycosyltransferase involved in cell wall biosynthesis